MAKPKTKADLFMPWGSWAIGEWPENVYPNNPDSGRHICRAHRDDLMEYGALVRVGRELVVMGAAYYKWLTSNAKGVRDIDMPPNAPALIAKRKKKS